MGFDCSGFVWFVLKQAGLEVPDHFDLNGVRRQTRHANEYLDHLGTHVHFGAHQPGDVAIFSNNGIVPTHTGIIVGPDTYAHAPGREDTSVIVSSLSRRAIQQTGILLTPYVENPVAIKSPVIPTAQPNQRYYQRPI